MLRIHKDLREIHIVGARSRECRLASQAFPAMNSCGILWAGWTNARWGYRFVRLNPPFSGLIVCQEGMGHVWVQGRWHPCRADQAYLLPHGAMHAYRADPRRRWKICWVALEPSAAGALNDGEARLVHADARPFRAAIDGLQREINGPAEPYAVQRWVELIRLYALRIGGPQHDRDRLGMLWEQVDANLARPWSLDDLAEAAGLSSEHLRRLCHVSLKSSPMRHLARMRMRRAAALLTSTSQKIAVIAHAVGYTNPFAFSSSFARHMGIAPAAYRAQRGLVKPRDQ